jgi:uncharacterized protein (DUF58 family)
VPSPRPDALRLAERYRLALRDAPLRGTAGDRLGRGTGSSLEFQDRRAYAAGDDLRHLDWRAFARTDQLLVRQYREETLPRLDVVLDGSRSMGVDPEKAQLAVDLAAFLALAGRAEGQHVAIVLLGERPERIELDRLLAHGAGFEARVPGIGALESASGELRHGSLRIVVSDFLFPHDPAALVRPLALRGSVVLVQVLARADREPPVGAPVRLVDAETGEHEDLVLDPRTVERYRERVKRLADGLATECRRTAARFATLTAGEDLDRACRETLVPAGVLLPA